MKLSEYTRKEAPKSEHPVTIHACERYAQRVMDQDIKEGSLNFKQIQKLAKLLLRILKEEHPYYLKYKNGMFQCKSYDCVIVMKEGKIVTVKPFKNEGELTYRDADGYEEIIYPEVRHSYKGGKKQYIRREK